MLNQGPECFPPGNEGTTEGPASLKRKTDGWQKNTQRKMMKSVFSDMIGCIRA